MNFQKIEEKFYNNALKIETGKLAKQADGSVILQFGETVLLATVVSSRTTKPDQDFFPLSVDYRERTTAAGKFRGGYMKRETRPSQKETLTSRLVDRSLRPIFPEGFINEVQVFILVISADKQNDPDALAILAASAALSVSSIPFHNPVGGVRVGRVAGKLIINPTRQERLTSDIDLIIAGNKHGILMVEGHSQGISDKELLEAIDYGFNAVKQQVEMQVKLIAQVKPVKEDYELHPIDKNIVHAINEAVQAKLGIALYTQQKSLRAKAVAEIQAQTLKILQEKNPELDKNAFKNAFKEVESQVLRSTILNEHKRADGRGLQDIRPIWIENGLLPKTHGSSVFTRGETQALAVVTLGGAKDVQRYEDFGVDIDELFYLHYTFQGYSVGECKPYRGVGRREIGHGVLAERALRAMIPPKEIFPYTIRITSDILESNGSSSMASVCAGSLALMDAGVPIKSGVSGIAMGLIQEGSRVAVLSDILGLEDALGDMDFKVAGPRDSITSFQMDIKIEGLSFEVMKKALYQAMTGKNKILDEMEKSLSAPRSLSQNAPRIYNIKVPQDKIGTVIGPGGKMIRSLTEKYGVTIDIAEDGMVSVQGENSEKADRCLKEISALTAEIEVGKTYNGTVRSIKDFGAFVECIPGKDGLLHISRISNQRINKISDVLQVGQSIEVKCIGVDEKGRVVLSHVDLEQSRGRFEEPA